MLSIIIPSLNEEKYLPLLLESVNKQNFSDYEIILADAGSKDKTIKIAEKYNCKIVAGGMPARGRNEGAKKAQGDILFFVDADVILPDNFLQNTLNEFNKKNLDIASFCLFPLNKNKIQKFLLDFFYNKPIIILENILPHAAMGIIVKKTLFEKVGGFDEEVKIAEDHYFARVAKKKFKAKTGIIRSTHLLISDRRFKTDGWLRTGLKYFLCEMYMIFIGPPKSNLFVYKFNHYDKNK